MSVSSTARIPDWFYSTTTTLLQCYDGTTLLLLYYYCERRTAARRGPGMQGVEPIEDAGTCFDFARGVRGGALNPLQPYRRQ